MDARPGRRSYRFRLKEFLPATFNGVPVAVVDIAEGGVQLEYTIELPCGTEGKLELAIPRRKKRMTFQGQLVWTRTLTGDAPVTVYRCGVRIDSDSGALNAAIDFLTRQGFATIDRGSRQADVTATSPEPQGPAGIPSAHLIDYAALIEDARERLAGSFEESLKWYNRARFSLAEAAVQKQVEDIHHKEDVLAVWEFLERKVDIATIATIFERRR